MKTDTHKAEGAFKIGDLVRFANEQDGGAVHRVVSVMANGMIEVNDFAGYFAPHLFAIADDESEGAAVDIDAKWREIIDGLEGVTPGPWKRVEGGVEKTFVEDPFGNTLCQIPWYREKGYSAHRDAEFIARLDPDTIRSLASAYEEVKRERDEAAKQAWQWKAEAEKSAAEEKRVRDAHKTDIGHPLMTMSDVIVWLRDHRFTHSDWASWLEKNPNDPRADGVGSAEFHRKVEARYNEMIRCLEAAEAALQQDNKGEAS